jgi:hypothetical protein
VWWYLYNKIYGAKGNRGGSLAAAEQSMHKADFANGFGGCFPGKSIWYAGFSALQVPTTVLMSRALKTLDLNMTMQCLILAKERRCHSPGGSVCPDPLVPELEPGNQQPFKELRPAVPGACPRTVISSDSEKSRSP